ncbi:MAG: UDP-N-acetylmuramate:L-alanyl-gamma-D-glutamyl-meso-diaminopimelate ligase [Halofilum sp. (in: g-proteobacteria)]|nr:UDP-N-acetylmuramate:L-alanyl-gamma-D-glutamyl-meso-diaminopimelate ligase [Halofilum sp. (in: g-proteobacteria)]
MHLHILGICGTFMGGIAQLAAAHGHRVTGSDANVYPPMSDQLEAAGIRLTEGWDPAQLEPAPDLVVIGNALARGNPAVEAVLDRGLDYASGPEWLREHVLRGRHVLAVAGTHGKTTTASMLAHVLDRAGLDPGFLIGGVPGSFGVSARAGSGDPFVVEADEYDSAFFDKRSKFVHYRPRTLVLHNLEFDHADIFDDLAAIQRQFHHLVRTVPGSGRLLVNAEAPALREVLDLGCWTPVEWLSVTGVESDWRVTGAEADGSAFTVEGPGGSARVHWNLLGQHNLANGLAAVAAAGRVGVNVETACEALSGFPGVRRRLEIRAQHAGITLYDDFAHHPTAIATTLAGLRARVGEARILVALDLASNTMRAGVHAGRLGEALAAANRVYLHAGRELAWQPGTLVEELGGRAEWYDSADALAGQIGADWAAGDHVVLMSNGGFGGLPGTLAARLEGGDHGE